MRAAMLPMLSTASALVLAHNSSFTAANGTLITAYTPDVGSGFTLLDGGGARIQSNVAHADAGVSRYRSVLSGLPRRVEFKPLSVDVFAQFWTVSLGASWAVWQRATALELWEGVTGVWYVRSTLSRTFVSGEIVWAEMSATNDNITFGAGADSKSFLATTPIKSAAIGFYVSSAGDLDNLKAWI